METLHLWLMECEDNSFKNLSRLFTFYSRSREEAECIVKDYLAQHPSLVFVTLDERPEGFRVINYFRPGQIKLSCEG